MSMTGRFLAVSAEQLADVVTERVAAIDLLFPADETASPTVLDIDKSWHAIHYLLTSDPWEGEFPLCRVILGGEPIGEDIGYGPARYLRPDEVVETASALECVPFETLRQRFGDGMPLKEADIYPEIWHGGTDAFDYVYAYFKELVAFYRATADTGKALLLFIV